MEVIVRKEKETGNLILLFPYQIENSRGDFNSFTLQEGHSPCSHGYYLTGTLVPSEYDLKSNAYKKLIDEYVHLLNCTQSEEFKIIKKINLNKQLELIRNFKMVKR